MHAAHLLTDRQAVAHLAPTQPTPQPTAQGDAASRDQAAADQAAAAEAPEAPAQPSRAAGVKISAKKLEFIKTMLLRKLTEETDHQEALAVERRQQRAAAAGGGDDAGAMDVDDAAAPRAGGEEAVAGDQGTDKPGLKQQDLVDWYMEMQINRKAITTYEEGESEYDLVFKVISHMIKRDGLLVVVTAPRRAAGEGADAYRNRVWKERRLALSPSYVPE